MNAAICSTLCLNGAISVLQEGILNRAAAAAEISTGITSAVEMTNAVGSNESSTIDDELLALLLHALAHLCVSRDCQAATRSARDLHDKLVGLLDSRKAEALRWASQSIAEMCHHSIY